MSGVVTLGKPRDTTTTIENGLPVSLEDDALTVCQCKCISKDDGNIPAHPDDLPYEKVSTTIPIGFSRKRLNQPGGDWKFPSWGFSYPSFKPNLKLINSILKIIQGKCRILKARIMKSNFCDAPIITKSSNQDVQLPSLTRKKAIFKPGYLLQDDFIEVDIPDEDLTMR